MAMNEQSSADPFENRLEFETLISDLSSRFINLSPHEVDHEIEDALRCVCELLGIDYAVLWQRAATTDVIAPTHAYPPREPSGPGEPLVQELYPWVAAQMRAGRMVVVSSLDEMPEEAALDRESARRLGIKSSLCLPLSVGGASPVGAAVSGGFPVTGGLARSVVNFEAGAETPAAGAFTAVGIALVTLFLTPLLFFLPKATLAATIIVAVLSLIDFGAMKRTWIYSKADFAAMAATILVTLVEGVELGLIVGVGLSIFLHLYATSRPHVAVVGQIPGTAHFRNVARHAVMTDPEILSLRVDASLYFPNARFLEDLVNDAVAANPAVRHVILECPAVNTIDISGLESLEAINRRLEDGGITFHLSEVKGPVMDRLKRSHFLHELTGKVHLTQFDAVSSINPELARRTLEAPRP
jgi:anti-anti-sigma regulatory factor